MNYIKINTFEMYKSKAFNDIVASYNQISDLCSLDILSPITLVPDIKESSKTEDTKVSAQLKSPISKLADSMNKMFDSGDIVNIDFSSPVGEPIYLPIPSTVEEEFSQRFDISSFNPGAMIASALAEKFMDKLESVSKTTASVTKDIKTLAQLMLTRANISIDPNTIMTYAGSNPRLLTLGINVNPRSAKEHQMYSKSINQLREASKAIKKKIELVDGLNIGILDQKHIFTIDFVSIDNDVETILEYMTDIMGFSSNVCKGFLLTDMMVSTGDTNGTTLYEDGTPKTIDVSLTFQERTPLFRNNFDVMDKYIKEKYSIISPSSTLNYNRPTFDKISEIDLKDKYIEQVEQAEPNNSPKKDEVVIDTAVIKQMENDDYSINNNEYTPN